MRDDVKRCAECQSGQVVEWPTQADVALLHFADVMPLINQRQDPPPAEIS